MAPKPTSSMVEMRLPIPTQSMIPMRLPKPTSSAVPSSTPESPTGHLPENKEITQKYMTARDECKKEQTVSEDSVARYERTQEVGSDLGCFAGCVAYKLGSVKPDGGFDTKTWGDYVSRIDDSEQRRQLWDIGARMSRGLDGLDRCNSGNKLAEMSRQFSTTSDSDKKSDKHE